MKRIYLALMLVLTACVGVSAQSLDYLTVRTADGGERSLAVDDLKLTFEDGQLVAHTPETVVTWSLTDLSLMYFAAQPTAIATLAQEQPAPVYRNGVLTVSAPAGTSVRLYAADGRLVATYVKSADGSESFTPALPHGVYIVNAHGGTAKFLAR